MRLLSFAGAAAGLLSSAPLVALSVSALLASAAPFQDDRLPELTERTLDGLYEAILPSEEDEAWRRLPWHTTYWEGVIAAQEADKPILLFAMNGHPFGCT